MNYIFSLFFFAGLLFSSTDHAPKNYDWSNSTKYQCVSPMLSPLKPVLCEKSQELVKANYCSYLKTFSIDNYLCVNGDEKKLEISQLKAVQPQKTTIE